MKKVFLSIAAMAVLSVSCGGEGREVESEDSKEVVDNSTETTVTYATVGESSKVNWLGSHLLGVDPHNGHFKLSEGTVSVTDGKVTNGNFTIDITSLTDEDIEDPEKRGMLEGHLKSSDFFNDSLYPTAKFEISTIADEANEEGTFTSKVTGNFTMKDSTRAISFFANVAVTDTDVTMKSEKFTIDRTQWGMHYGAEGTPNLTEDKVIANAVTIDIDVTLTK